MKMIYSVTIYCLTLLMVFSCSSENEPVDLDAQFNSKLQYGSVSDVDGNVYKTITIGTQTWMAENLRTTKYKNGITIPNVIKSDNWYALKTGAYCTYNNTNNKDSIVKFGRHYNGYAVLNPSGIAPAGWHLPTDVEWGLLQDYLSSTEFNNGMQSTTITKLLASSAWLSGKIGANKSSNNKSGFSVLPSGFRAYYGTFKGIDSSTSFFGKGTDPQYSPFYWISIGENSTSIDSWGYGGVEGNGFSVRCIKD